MHRRCTTKQSLLGVPCYCNGTRLPTGVRWHLPSVKGRIDTTCRLRLLFVTSTFAFNPLADIPVRLQAPDQTAIVCLPSF